MIFLGVDKMYKCLLWGTGKGFYTNTQLIKYYELLGDIEVVGVTSNEKIYHDVMGWTFISKQDIKKICVDIIILMVEKHNKSILGELSNMGYESDQVVDVNTMKIPGFNMDCYLQIKKRTPTIFSPMCWGGVTYHSLGLEFKTPFINMFLHEDDYMQFLESPESYIKMDIVYDRMEWNRILEKNYPVARCGDIELHFNHYSSFEIAKNDWDKRKKRIDWNNILVMMFTEKIDTVKRFLEMSYDKKILFTSLAIDDDRVVHMDIKNKYPIGMDLWTAINETAKGKFLSYNVFELMMDGKISYLMNNRM